MNKKTMNDVVLMLELEQARNELRKIKEEIYKRKQKKHKIIQIIQINKNTEMCREMDFLDGVPVKVVTYHKNSTQYNNISSLSDLKGFFIGYFWYVDGVDIDDLIYAGTEITAIIYRVIKNLKNISKSDDYPYFEIYFEKEVKGEEYE